jgi:hypothetical protein
MLRATRHARTVRGGRIGEWNDVREQLVAWAEDCRVQGEVDLGGGRISDLVNDADLLTFHAATLVALDDGHIVRQSELEVARRELSLIEVSGHRGDPDRRVHTVPERVRLEIGPYVVTGDLHRLPSLPALNALTKWSRFVPVTGAVLDVEGSSLPRAEHDVLLVNRDRIRAYHELHDAGPAWTPPLEPGADGVPAAVDDDVADDAELQLLERSQPTA